MVLFAADDSDQAIAKAEVEAAQYVDGLNAEVGSLFQSFAMYDDPVEGSEVFSLMRGSSLEPDDYIDRFFDTGHERQQHLE